MKKSIILIIILAVAGGFWFWESNAPVTENNNEPIKIGLATILTGDFAILGENISNTARLEVDEINKNGGINGRQVELYIEDSQMDSKGGLNAVQKLVNVDGVKYIIGGMASNGTIAAAPIVNQNHSIIMTPVTGGKNVDEAGDYIFRIANSDILAGRDLANAMIKKGYKKVAVVSAVTEYTLDIKKSFEETIKANGGEVVASEEFKSGTTDYRTLVTKVKSANPSAVLVLSQAGTDAAYFIKQGKELGYNPEIYTDFTLALNSSVKEILGSLDGVYFADPKYDENDATTKGFFEEYKAKYGKYPMIPFHTASTYDGIMMLKHAIEKNGDDSVKVQDWLTKNIKNYKGMMGTYSLDEKGNSDLGFVIKVIKDGKPVEVK